MPKNKKGFKRTCPLVGCGVKPRVLIAAGGSGGHLFPAQQLAKMLGDTEIFFAGHKIGASPFFEREGVSFEEIGAGPLGRGFVAAAWRGFWQAMRLIRRFSPDVVVGFGSYHAFPVLLAAAFLRKKIVLFEANSSLGKVNRFFRFAAEVVACQLPLGVRKEELVPLLPWKEVGDRLTGGEAKKRYGLDPDRLTILVFGGSQGASFLNKTAPLALAKLTGVQAIHFTGPADAEAVRSKYRELGISACVKPFETEMAHAYAAADLAICRSGAGTIAELIRFELPAILVPYPNATQDHQRKNGAYLADAVGGAHLVVQAEADVDRLAAEIEALHSTREEKKSRLQKAFAEHQNRIHLSEIVRRVAG